MKILHVTECFAGGVSRAVSRIPVLAPQHEHILLAQGNDISSQLDSPFAKVHQMPKGATARIRAVREISRNYGVDLIHAHSSWAGVYCRTLPLPIPVVYQPHGYAMNKGGKLQKSLFHLAEKMLSQRSVSTVVLSPHEHQTAMLLNSKASAVYLPNVPSQPITGTKHTVDTILKKRMVVAIGRICAQKDPAYFAKVAALVHQVDSSIQFTWIGDGDSALRKVLEANNVTVTGWMEGDALLEYLDEAILYIHTARYEGFPLSVLDAAARQVPIIVRNIPAFEGTGLKSVQSVQEMCLSIITAIASASECQMLLERGQSLLAHMNEESQAEALKSLYGGHEAAIMEVAK